MALCNLIALAIMLTAGATLHLAAGKTDIDSSQMAAEALRPIGANSHSLSSRSVIGTGFMAVPVLAGSASYAIGEALCWPVGRHANRRRRAPFMVLATAVGTAINVLPVDPGLALYWSAVINGAPIIAVMMHLRATRA